MLNDLADVEQPIPGRICMAEEKNAEIGLPSSSSLDGGDWASPKDFTSSPVLFVEFSPGRR
jgi:hypothetical protein